MGGALCYDLAMKDRPKFFRHCGSGVELRVEQIGPSLWGGSVYHGWLLAIPEIHPWRAFTEFTEEAAKREAMTVVEKLPRPDQGADEEWRDQSDMPDEHWQRNLEHRGFSGYPPREGIERWNGL